MRGLFLDFPNDPNVADIGDEYMFGPALLVAPVTDQGATEPLGLLARGIDWFNYWTNERVHGGQRVVVAAPIETIPVFVRAGSILPLGVPIESTNQEQAIARIRVYPGADADFSLYSDDGNTYAYEHGDFRLTSLHWDNKTRKLAHSGADAWDSKRTDVIEVIRPVKK